MAYHGILEEGRSKGDFRQSKNNIKLKELLSLNHSASTQFSLATTSTSTLSTSTSPRNALITESPGILELRQNNPQDCTNLIIASVDRATVEISRTIIALNATFSQQLQEVLISASNGIKSAEASASTTISAVSQSASVATASALSSLAVANLAVSSFSSASVNDVAKVSLASSRDVSNMSASLSLLQLSITSLQVSASSALASAQSAMSSASAASDAAAGVADEAPAPTSGPLAGSAGPVEATKELCATGTLPLAQVLAIGIGAAIMVTLLSFAVYFIFVMMKRRKQARDSYLDENNFATSPKNLTTRYSSNTRTGNTITLKFNATESPEKLLPSQPEMHHPFSSRAHRMHDSLASRLPSWPLTFSFMRKNDVAPGSLVTKVHESRPLQDHISATLTPRRISSHSSSRAISWPTDAQAMVSTVSPLRRSPFITDIAFSPADPEESLPVDPIDEDEDKDEYGGPDDIREQRGRSMIRTSDIIESPL